MPSVAVVGASSKPERISHQAVEAYRNLGWTVWPVHPSAISVAGLTTYGHLDALPARPDIVCMYVNPAIGMEMLEAIVRIKPTVLWLNPGADGEPLVSAARERGLRVIEACTLVVMRRGDPLEIALRQ